MLVYAWLLLSRKLAMHAVCACVCMYVYMHVRVCVSMCVPTPRLLITREVIIMDLIWLVKQVLSFYMAAVVNIISIGMALALMHIV